MSENVRMLEHTLKAFANKRRLAIIKLLRTREERSVGEIAEEIKLSMRSTSRHLLVLRAAGVLVADQRSTYMYYRLNPKLNSATKAILSLL